MEKPRIYPGLRGRVPDIRNGDAATEGARLIFREYNHGKTFVVLGERSPGMWCVRFDEPVGWRGGRVDPHCWWVTEEVLLDVIRINRRSGDGKN